LYGGALQVHYLLRGLADREGVESVLVCPSGSAIAEAARENVKTLHAVPMRGDLDLLFIHRLLDIIRKETPDIIHLHSRRGADILGGIAARLSGTPCILTRRVDNPESRMWAGMKYRLYHHVVTISDGIREVLLSEGVQHHKITCVHSAVDTQRYATPCDKAWFNREFGLEEGSLTCGTLAQFIERKGHRYLFEAIPEIVNMIPKARFILFGKGPLEGSLRSYCKSLGIEDKVLFAGFREDLDRIMGCLDLVIHPALMEGLGVSLLQAASAGVPIVGTRIGGIPEIVRDGENGYVIPPGEVSPLVDVTTRILMDRDLARQLGEGGRKIAIEHFPIESMVEGNLGVYQGLLGNPR
ncbi:glycosyltransferase family 4 protein, partial [bacterium]|nr:glycosyltransferase family 4 protein [bacterium]